MSPKFFLKILFPMLFIGLVLACEDDNLPPEPPAPGTDLTDIPYSPKAYDLQLPSYFPSMFIPVDNPLTEEGVQLGRRLFFDPILSADGSMACAGCHMPEKGFADGKAVSEGIDGISGTRSSMSLINAGFFERGLFWDGRSTSLEAQALLPVEDPIELHDTWENVEAKLQKDEDYPSRFRKAFGIASSTEISKELAAKALAQYQRALVSFDSKYDRVITRKAFWDDDNGEGIGFAMFFDNTAVAGNLTEAECGHCHNAPLFTTDDFFDNGIEANISSMDAYPDIGLGKVTGFPEDNGKFRAPSLRNIALTAPYMHDGRFQTLEEVLDHYSSGGHITPNRDIQMRKLDLTDEEKQNLLAFLHALTDTSYLQNPLYQNPF